MLLLRANAYRFFALAIWLINYSSVVVLCMLKLSLKLARQSPPSDRGRKVRAAQSGMTVNGRPLKAVRYKARNRATETSRCDQRACEFASQRVKRGNLHLQQDQIGWQ